MPEGPEVETIRLDIEPLLLHQKIQNIWVNPVFLPNLKQQAELKILENTKITNLGRHGKLLWIDTDSKQSLLLRLGMTGRLSVQKQSDPVEAHTHVRLKLASDKEFRFVDPRRFGKIIPVNLELKKATIDRMGPDPFSWNQEDKNTTARKIQKSRRNIKNILLDQSIISGVGNIYASEALYVAKIHPEQTGAVISINRLLELLDASELVMKTALKNRGTSFMSYVDGWGEKGDNFAHLFVFAKAGKSCPSCTQIIKKITQSGRSTFFCSKCQPTIPFDQKCQQIQLSI